MNRAVAFASCLAILAGCGDDVGTGGAGTGAGGAAAGGASTTTGGAGGAGGQVSVGGAGGAGTGGAGTGGGAPVLSCNPVTNEPCDTQANEACDFNGNGGFECFPGNSAGLCEPCGDGMWCLGGLTCTNEDQKCAKFCCDDADCGSGTCKKDPVIPEIGICITAAMTSDCEAPLVSPSLGGCYMPL